MATRLNFRTVVVVPCERNTLYTARFFNPLKMRPVRRARLAASRPLISSLKQRSELQCMRSRSDRASKRGNLEVDLFPLNGFDSYYLFLFEKTMIDKCCVGSGVKYRSLPIGQLS